MTQSVAYLAGSVQPPSAVSGSARTQLLRDAETRVAPTDPAARVVGSARVSDIEAFFGRSLATHVVAVEYADQEVTLIRGLISRTRLERQLGHPVSQHGPRELW